MRVRRCWIPPLGTSPAPLATLVIPALREGTRLPRLVAELVELGLAGTAPPVEFVVVDGGSGPDDLACEREATLAAGARLEQSGSTHRFRFLALPRDLGKGAAVRHGWEQADPGASWLGFVDGDGAVSARETWRLVGLLERSDDFDVLAGTRMLMAGHTIRRSAYRHVQGRIFATLVEAGLELGFYDTQCGAKLFRASLLRPLLPILHEERWLLDVEVLALLRRTGARCREEPIDWADPGGSKVRPLDPARMALGLWRMRRRLRGGSR